MTDQPDPAPGAGRAPAPGPAAPPPGTPLPPPAPTSGTWGQTSGHPSAVPGWGGAPAPAARPRGPKGTSGRTAFVVLVVIVGVLFGVNLVNAALPLPEDPAVVDPGPGIPIQPDPTAQPLPEPTEDTGQPQPGETLTPVRTLPPLDPGPVEPGESVDVGGGFVVVPPSGWTSVGGEDGAVFQKGGVLLIVIGFPWEQSADELASVYRDAWFTGGEFTGDNPQSAALGNGIPAAGLNYTGIWNGGQVDGTIIAGAVSGSGLIINVVGPTGSLNPISGELDAFLDTVQHTGG